MSAPAKEYLGDGVYVDWDPQGGLWLTTEDGIRTTNRIYLESAVWLALSGYVARVTAHVSKVRETKDARPCAICGLIANAPSSRKGVASEDH